MRFQQQEIVVVALKKPFFLRKRGEGGGSRPIFGQTVPWKSNRNSKVTFGGGVGADHPPPLNSSEFLVLYKLPTYSHRFLRRPSPVSRKKYSQMVSCVKPDDQLLSSLLASWLAYLLTCFLFLSVSFFFFFFLVVLASLHCATLIFG